MKAGDLARILLSHPDRDVVVRLVPIEGLARTLEVRRAGRAPLTDRFLLEALDPEGQLEIETKDRPKEG